MPEILKNYINGEFVASSSTETIDLINPTDESVVGRSPVSTTADIDAAMTNICRCGTYNRVRAAIHLAAGQVQRKQIPIVIEGGQR